MEEEGGGGTFWPNRLCGPRADAEGKMRPAGPSSPFLEKKEGIRLVGRERKSVAAEVKVAEVKVAEVKQVSRANIQKRRGIRKSL
jgi:hypothetical protein